MALRPMALIAAGAMLLGLLCAVFVAHPRDSDSLNEADMRESMDSLAAALSRIESEPDKSAPIIHNSAEAFIRSLPEDDDDSEEDFGLSQASTASAVTQSIAAMTDEDDLELLQDFECRNCWELNKKCSGHSEDEEEEACAHLAHGSGCMHCFTLSHPHGPDGIA